MSSIKGIGIHIARSQATIVGIEKDGSTFRPLPAETFPLEPTADMATQNDFYQQLRKTLAAKGWTDSPVTLSLSGHWYRSMQHISPFTDPVQIERTLKYDVEEDLAQDADETALCYQQCRINDDGTHLIVHTGGRMQLEELFQQFEAVEMDALVAEPDIASWWHYLRLSNELPAGQACIAVGQSQDNLSILAFDNDGRPVLARSLPAAGDQAIDMLEYELNRSLATLPESLQPQILVYHELNLDSVGLLKLADKFELKGHQLSQPDMMSVCAAGVAWNWLAGKAAVDFRADGLMPKTIRKARNAAFLGVSAATTLVLLAAIAVCFLHAQKWQTIAWDTNVTIENAYKTVFPNKRIPPFETRIKKELEDVRKNLEEKIRIKEQKVLPDSASSTFMQTFNALNQLSLDFDIILTDMRFDAEVASLNGSVNDYLNMETLRQVFLAKECPLKIDSQKFNIEDNRGNASDSSGRYSFTLRLSHQNDSDDSEGRRR